MIANTHTIDFRYAPPSTWTAICRPDDPYKTLVREDGALLYGYRSNTFTSWYFERVIEFNLETGDKPLKVAQQTENARIPVVVTTIEYPRATLELRTFAHLDEQQRRTDIVLWTIRAHDNADELMAALHIEGFENNGVFVGRTDSPVRTIYVVDPKDKPRANGEPGAEWISEEASPPLNAEIAFVSAPHRLLKGHSIGFRPVSAMTTEMTVLTGGESVNGALMFPLNHEDTDVLDYHWALKALETERGFWNTLPLLALPLEIPDADVMDMMIACARNILQAREIVDGLPVFQVGAACYRGLWVVDGHFMLEAAQYLGYRDDAAAAINTLLRRVHPDGSIAQFPHHTKETGISITTLIRQTDLLGDETRLRELWPIIRKAVTFIEGMRDEARALPTEHPAYNLLPPSFADGGVAGKRGEYTTTFWVLAGLKWAANAANRLGYTEDATRFQSNFDDLMADFVAHSAKHMRTLPDGTPYLPMIYPGSGEHNHQVNYEGTVHPTNQIQPESALWALCQSIWPGEVFAPDDVIVQRLNQLHDLRDDEQGIPATTGWLPYKALWTYHASFAAHVWLYSGRPDKAVDYLYAFANHAAPTRVWREEQSLVNIGISQICGDMPHNWASAEFIRLVRHLLVFERGNQLHLLPGMPSQWMRPGQVLRVEKTPTRFGPVTLSLLFGEDGINRLEITLDTRWSRQAEQVILHLPEAVTEVALDGVPQEVSGSRQLNLPIKNYMIVEFSVRQPSHVV
jgi:hypothetical protein